MPGGGEEWGEVKRGRIEEKDKTEPGVSLAVGTPSSTQWVRGGGHASSN